MRSEKEKILEHVKDLTGCFVAGGAVTSVFTNADIADIDIYPKSAEALETTIQWAFESSGWCSDKSTRAMTFKVGEMQIQIMHFDTFETADKIFECFDFTCCMGALDLDTKEFVLHPDFLKHCSQRFLKFNASTRFPYASAWRVQKYQGKGFTIGKMEFMKILLACQNLPIASWDDLRNQVGGVYGEALDIPEDEPFSYEGALKALNTLRFQQPQGGYESAEKAILAVAKREIEYVTLPAAKGTATQILAKLGGDWTAVDEKPANGREVTVTDVYPGGLFYKVVVREGEHYRSQFHSHFKYRIGESVESGSPYIFVTTRDRVGSIYEHVGNRAILELRAEPEDIIYGHYELTVKKCLVVRDVTEELTAVPETAEAA